MSLRKCPVSSSLLREGGAFHESGGSGRGGKEMKERKNRFCRQRGTNWTDKSESECAVARK